MKKLCILFCIALVIPANARSALGEMIRGAQFFGSWGWWALTSPITVLRQTGKFNDYIGEWKYAAQCAGRWSKKHPIELGLGCFMIGLGAKKDKKTTAVAVAIAILAYKRHVVSFGYERLNQQNNNRVTKQQKNYTYYHLQGGVAHKVSDQEAQELLNL
ncbi:MAG: hypothetical protein WD068_03215 [Candidatus Babeliales bacterium]